MADELLTEIQKHYLSLFQDVRNQITALEIVITEIIQHSENKDELLFRIGATLKAVSESNEALNEIIADDGINKNLESQFIMLSNRLGANRP